jgi:hypothetical protein
MKATVKAMELGTSLFGLHSGFAQSSEVFPLYLSSARVNACPCREIDSESISSF